MSISDEQEAQILRYFHAEKWKIGTIAKQLGIHHLTVRRVLVETGTPPRLASPRPSKLDPYMPFIMEQLEKFPTLTASRLYDMACERGYVGSSHHFRHMIALRRPRKPAEAFLRLRTLPGEQGQIDWGHFGHVIIGRAKRPLIGFVMVLSYSRKICLRFYLNAQMANFLRGHEESFQAFGGVPRVILYDNLKSAVLERHNDAIRFNPELLRFSAHYCYEPRPVAVARGNEKGRVERAIRYIRNSFFAAREWKDLDDLNQQARQWCEGHAAQRPCPEDPSTSVQEAFLEEQKILIDLPANPYENVERVSVNIGKTPYARFDLNDYSVPHTAVRGQLTIVATPTSVHIIDGAKTLAKHKRSYGKGEQIEEPSHIEELHNAKRQSRKHRQQDRLISSTPSCKELLVQGAARGYVMKTAVNTLNDLLDTYGACELEAAVKESLAQGSPHPNSVRLCLERRREAQNKPPKLLLPLSADPRVNTLTVKPHNLDSYGRLQRQGEDDE